MKTSKVLSVAPYADPQTGQQKTFQSQNGVLYSFYVTMENQDAGEYQAKTAQQDYFVVGKEVEYEFDTTYPNYPKIKRAKKEYSAGGKSYEADPKKLQSIERQTALKAAVEFNRDRSGKTSGDVIGDASKFYQWLSMEKPVQGSATRQELKNEEAPPEFDPTDQLPF